MAGEASLEGPGIDGSHREYRSPVAKFSLAVACADRVNIGRHGTGVKASEIFLAGADAVAIVIDARKDIVDWGLLQDDSLRRIFRRDLEQLNRGLQPS